MPATTTIYAAPTSIFASAKNSKFPKLTEIAAIRFMRPHDFARTNLRLREDCGFVTRKVPVVGRVPTVQA